MKDVIYSSKSAEWETPKSLFATLDREFGFDLDACATDENHKWEKYFTRERNGLAQSWAGHRVWCNPPYGRTIKDWVEKAYTESKIGEMLDSAADLFFAVVYAVKILPFLNIPLWIWIWTVIIASAKITEILIASKKTHRLSIEHSFGNKLMGLLLFFLPLSVCVVDVKYTAPLVCAVATGTVIKEITNIC